MIRGHANQTIGGTLTCLPEVHCLPLRDHSSCFLADFILWYVFEDAQLRAYWLSHPAYFSRFMWPQQKRHYLPHNVERFRIKSLISFTSFWFAKTSNFSEHRKHVSWPSLWKKIFWRASRMRYAFCSRNSFSSHDLDPSNTADERPTTNQMSPANEPSFARPACVELCVAESKDGNAEYASQEVLSEIMKLLTWWALQQRNQQRENNLNSSNPIFLSDTSSPPTRYHRKNNKRNTHLSTNTINWILWPL